MVIFRLRIQCLLILSLLLTAFKVCPARAESLGLDFSLPEHQTAQPEPEPVLQASSAQTYQPLPVPQAASQPPTRSSQAPLPSTIYGGVDGLSIPSNKANEDSNPALAQLPPPPPLPASVPTTQVFPPLRSSQSDLRPSATRQSDIKQTELAPDIPSRLSTTETAKTVTFEIPTQQPLGLPPAEAPTTVASTASPVASLSAAADMSWIFKGASDSLVARAIGSAEGTRTPDGKRTRYYRGHTDPGNGVWNLGTFSYQHGASSPEEADAKQLARLKRQGETLKQKAQNAGIDMDLVRTLNALDLANQSPAAALNRGGYIDRLVEAESQGLQGEDAILWARINSYRHPDTQRWNAPGLGNTLEGVSRDQKRRFDAIASALDAYQREQLSVVPGSLPETRVLPPQNPTTQATSPETSQASESLSQPVPLASMDKLPVNPEDKIDFSLKNEPLADRSLTSSSPVAAANSIGNLNPLPLPQPQSSTDNLKIPTDGLKKM